MSTVADQLTADEYLAREDPRRTELIDGVVVVNVPTVLDQRVVGLIYAALLAWTQSGPGRGTVSLPLDVRLDDATVLAPAVLWFAREIDLGAPRAPRMPDLAVEVRSPATWVYDVGPKRELYERHGYASCGWRTPRPARCWSIGASAQRAASTPKPNSTPGSNWRHRYCPASPQRWASSCPRSAKRSPTTRNRPYHQGSGATGRGI